jgi:hypothetical protein
MGTTHRTGNKNDILYPLMLIAAVAVIIFSVVSIATVTGLLPYARSGGEPAATDGAPAGRIQQPVPASRLKQPN